MASQDKISNIFVSFRANLSRAVAHIVPPKEIEDIVQEAYVRVCQVKHQEDIQHPRSFLMRTAKNLAFDYLKRAETQRADGVEEEADYEPYAAAANSDETYEKVASDQEFSLFCQTVRQLPQQCRKVFVLKKVYGYSQREIALELEISESTVEKHVANGIKRCTYMMMQQETSGQLQGKARAHSTLAEAFPLHAHKHKGADHE